MWTPQVCQPSDGRGVCSRYSLQLLRRFALCGPRSDRQLPPHSPSATCPPVVPAPCHRNSTPQPGAAAAPQIVGALAVGLGDANAGQPAREGQPEQHGLTLSSVFCQSDRKASVFYARLNCEAVAFFWSPDAVLDRAAAERARSLIGGSRPPWERRPALHTDSPRAARPKKHHETRHEQLHEKRHEKRYEKRHE